MREVLLRMDLQGYPEVSYAKSFESTCMGRKGTRKVLQVISTNYMISNEMSWGLYTGFRAHHPHYLHGGGSTEPASQQHPPPCASSGQDTA